MSIEAANQALKEAANGKMKNILGYTEIPLVSVDFKGNKLSSIVDAELTMCVNNRMLKVLAWYDNEWGYSNRLIELAAFVASKLEIDELLAKLADKSEDHFGVTPDEIHWGHVGSLNHITAQLREIAAFVGV